MIDIKLKTKSFPSISVKKIIDDSGWMSGFISPEGKLYFIFMNQIWDINDGRVYGKNSNTLLSVLRYCNIEIREL